MVSAALPLAGDDAIARRELAVPGLKQSILFGLAEEMGGELSGLRGNPLRRSVEMEPSPKYINPKSTRSRIYAERFSRRR